MDHSRNRLHAWIVFMAAITVQMLTWFVLYPLAGYNDITLLIAQLVFLALGIGLIVVFKENLNQIGAGANDFMRGVIGISVSYGLLLVILVSLNALGYPNTIFRQEYQLYSFANNWLLTGFGEELVFAGLLFNLIARSMKDCHRWRAVLLTAVLFSFWHLPGYLAIGLRMGTLGPDLVFDLLLRMVSWIFFGTIYLLSGNLWLTSFAHASTDYALLPAVVNSPLLGLVFMMINLLIAWLLIRSPFFTPDQFKLFKINNRGKIVKKDTL